MADSLIETLERWEDHGAVWRIRHLSDAFAVVDLRTCDGDPVERLESDDRELITYLQRSGRSSA